MTVGPDGAAGDRLGYLHKASVHCKAVSRENPSQWKSIFLGFPSRQSPEYAAVHHPSQIPPLDMVVCHQYKQVPDLQSTINLRE